MPEERVMSNSYHLVPGKSYVKDPTMTVEKGSEEAYVRMRVTINMLKELDAIFAPNGVDLTEIFVGYSSANWELTATTRDTSANTITYEFRCPTTVDAKEDAVVLDPLFDKIHLPGFVTGDQLSKLYVDDQNKLTITIVGDAIQAETFANADAAWVAFEAQNVNN